MKMCAINCLSDAELGSKFCANHTRGYHRLGSPLKDICSVTTCCVKTDIINDDAFRYYFPICNYHLNILRHFQGRDDPTYTELFVLMKLIYNSHQNIIHWQP